MQHGVYGKAPRAVPLRSSHPVQLGKINVLLQREVWQDSDLQAPVTTATLDAIAAADDATELLVSRWTA